MSPDMAVTWLTPPRAKAQNSLQGERVGTHGTGGCRGWTRGEAEGVSGRG